MTNELEAENTLALVEKHHDRSNESMEAGGVRQHRTNVVVMWAS